MNAINPLCVLFKNLSTDADSSTATKKLLNIFLPLPAAEAAAAAKGLLGNKTPPPPILLHQKGPEPVWTSFLIPRKKSVENCPAQKLELLIPKNM